MSAPLREISVGENHPEQQRRVGTLDQACQRGDAVLECIAAHFDVDKDDRCAGLREFLDDLVGALGERKLGLPVVTTFMGRGLLQHAPDVMVGTYLGAAGDPTITHLNNGTHNGIVYSIAVRTLL